MIRRPPRSTQSRSSAASDVYKRQISTNDRVYEVARVLAGDVNAVRSVGVDEVVADAVPAAGDDQSGPAIRADLGARDPAVAAGTHSDSLIVAHVRLSKLTQPL